MDDEVQAILSVQLANLWKDNWQAGGVKGGAHIEANPWKVEEITDSVTFNRSYPDTGSLHHSTAR